MNKYLILLRGINVGGRNKIPMAELRKCLEKLGYSSVKTYIASGNAILQSDENPRTIKTKIESTLIKHFKLNSDYIKVLVLTQKQLQAVVDNKPKGFGDHPENYHSDVIFLIDMDSSQVMSVFNPKEGVDKIWSGDGVIYSQRLSAERTKSRLNNIVGTSAYKSMTIRNWNTTTKLLELLK